MDKDYILDEGAGLGLVQGDGLSPEAAAQVTKASRWGRYYLYITLGYFAVVIIVQVFGLTAVSALGGAGELGAFPPGSIVPLVIMYAVLLGLYVYPIYMFWRFVHDTPAGIRAGSQERFVAGINSLGSGLKYIGIFFLVIIGLYALLLVFAVVAGGLGAFAQ